MVRKLGEWKPSGLQWLREVRWKPGGSKVEARSGVEARWKPGQARWKPGGNRVESWGGVSGRCAQGEGLGFTAQTHTHAHTHTRTCANTACTHTHTNTHTTQSSSCSLAPAIISDTMRQTCGNTIPNVLPAHTQCDDTHAQRVCERDIFCFVAC
jgi:hypothetical protein